MQIPDESAVETAQRNKYSEPQRDFKLCLGLLHKHTDRFYYQMDAFDVLGGKLQDLDYVFWRSEEHKDYQDDKVTKLGGKVLQNIQYDSNHRWSTASNDFGVKVQAGDVMELVVSSKEKELEYRVNAEKVAVCKVRADYPMNEVHAGLKFHMYKTSATTVIEAL